MLKILYAGSPEISATALQDLINSKKVDIVGILTNAPRAKGRNKAPTQTAVAHVANAAAIPVLEPEKLTEEVRNQIVTLNPDILVCFAYGKIFGPKFMALFPKGGINLHASLLPKYRGASPVPAAILAGETIVGNTVQRIAQEMDTGDILLQKELLLNGSENSVEVLDTLTSYGADMILKVLSDIEENCENAVPQDNTRASYCSIMQKEDGEIDWNDSAINIYAKIKAFYGWPTAYTCVDGTIVTIHNASIYNSTGTEYENNSTTAGTIIGIDKKDGILIKTGKGILSVQNLQKQSKKAMNFKDFINGMKNIQGMTCTNSKNNA